MFCEQKGQFSQNLGNNAMKRRAYDKHFRLRRVTS
jgi:hypothetical protein